MFLRVVCVCLISVTASQAAILSCDYDLVESIPEGLTFPNSTIYSPTWRELVDIVNSSKVSLDIASLYWSLKGTEVMPDPDPSCKYGEALLGSLVAAAQRGVTVRIAVDHSRQDDPMVTDDLQELVKAGAHVRGLNFTKFIGSGVLHTKFLIADNETFYVGSANMDWRSLAQVKELGVRVNNCPALATDLAKIFEVYWYVGQSQTVPDTWPRSLATMVNAENPLPVTLGERSSAIYLSSSPLALNTDGRTNDIDAILNVIDSAQEFIDIAVMDYFPMFIYTNFSYWPVIDDRLKMAAIERGVTVRLLASHWEHTRKDMFNFLLSLDALRNYSNRRKGKGSISVKLFEVPATPGQRLIPFARVNHNKYMVTDVHGYIGTSNWSADYFINTAGVAFVVQDGANATKDDQVPSIRDKLHQVFERDWNSEFAHDVSN
ncbi:5'-3' exonuclease PLD3 [Halotydeus destructor]|nr:5'-3' exonuclease PLD3 [Halotydeus destructor]